MVDPSGMIDTPTTWLVIGVSATWFVMIDIPAARYMVIDVPATQRQVTIIRSRDIAV
jgi:hypothetical protein